eukprot:1527819-Rhodomonas_salina.2
MRRCRLDRLFGALDISKTGAITKDELFIFFEKARAPLLGSRARLACTAWSRRFKQRVWPVHT